MQDSYALMAKTMKDQYELQTIEPGLRCELNQVSSYNCALRISSET